MRQLLLLCVGIAMTACASQADTKASAISATDDGMYTIASGDIVMTVNAANGGKVASFTLNGQEAIAQHMKLEGVPFENPNDCGSTFWPSPQSTWNWPPIATYDSAPYSADIVGDTLVLVSGRDDKYPYVITKRFSPVDGGILVEYAITNAGDSAVTVAPWEITRVPSCGNITFQADSIWSTDNGVVTPSQVAEYTITDGIVDIPFAPERQNRKVFADGAGWLRHHGALTLEKRFPDIAQADAAPGEAEVEVYYNFGTTYTEIESQGAYTTLAPGASLTYPVVWLLTE